MHLYKLTCDDAEAIITAGSRSGPGGGCQKRWLP